MASKIRFPGRARKVVASVISGICALIAVGIIGYPAICANGTEQFNPKAYKGRTGKISLKYRGESSLLVRAKKDNKVMLLSTKNGIVTAPVGSYSIISYQAKATDKNKAAWVASASLSKPIAVEITANQTRQIDLGPPLVASVSVSDNGKRAYMNFKLTNAQGNHNYTITKTTGKTDPPGFRVLDSSGKSVWSGSFSYG